MVVVPTLAVIKVKSVATLPSGRTSLQVLPKKSLHAWPLKFEDAFTLNSDRVCAGMSSPSEPTVFSIRTSSSHLSMVRAHLSLSAHTS